MKTKHLFLLGTILCLMACTASRTTRVSSNLMLLDYQKDIQMALENKMNKPPTCEIWGKDRDEFIAMIEEYKARNEQTRKNASNTSLAFTITGTVIGVGGGIYGLFSNSEPKGAAVTSLVAGAVTGLVGSLNIQKKSERANSCNDFLNMILLDYKAFWGPARCPRTEEEFRDYLKAKDEIINEMKEMKCFGLADAKD